MPLAQAPSATPSFPTTISPPQNLDPLDASQLNTDVETLIQNGVEAARLLLYGGGIKRRVECTSNTVMNIKALGAVLAAVGGTTWTVTPNLTANTINPAALAGALAANTRYYVYAKLSAGPLLSFIVNTTAPDSGLNYMTGDASSLWVSTFYTDSASNIIKYKQSELSFIYTELSSSGGNSLLTAGNTSGTLAPGNSVPAFAAALYVVGFYGSNLAGTAGIIGQSGSSLAELVLLQGTDTDIDAAGQAKFSYDSIDWSTAAADASNSLNLWIKGFEL